MKFQETNSKIFIALKEYFMRVVMLGATSKRKSTQDLRNFKFCAG